jgi:hypothetical protein
VRRAAGGSLTGLLDVGLQVGSEALDMVGDMAIEPVHVASWGLDVTTKGAGLLQRLGRRYVLGTARQIIPSSTPKIGAYPKITVMNSGEKHDGAR